MKYLTLIIGLFLFIHTTNAQTDTTVVDTVEQETPATPVANKWFFISLLDNSSFSVGPRVLAAIGKKSSHVVTSTNILSFTPHKNHTAYAFVQLSKDMFELTKPGDQNPAADYMQLILGYKLKFKKFSADINCSFLVFDGPSYFDFQFATGIVIPNIHLRMQLHKMHSVGVWANYFAPLGGTGSAPMIRADYTLHTKYITAQLLFHYAGGFAGSDPGVNMGIHISSKAFDLSKTVNVAFKTYWYQNLWATGENPFTTNIAGGGIVFGFHTQKYKKSS